MKVLNLWIPGTYYGERQIVYSSYSAAHQERFGRSVMRVTSVGELPSEWRPELSWLVTAENYEELHALERITKAGITGIRVHVTNERLAESTFVPAIVSLDGDGDRIPCESLCGGRR